MVIHESLSGTCLFTCTPETHTVHAYISPEGSEHCRFPAPLEQWIQSLARGHVKKDGHIGWFGDWGLYSIPSLTARPPCRTDILVNGPLWVNINWTLKTEGPKEILWCEWHCGKSICLWRHDNPPLTMKKHDILVLFITTTVIWTDVKKQDFFIKFFFQKLNQQSLRNGWSWNYMFHTQLIDEILLLLNLWKTECPMSIMWHCVYPVMSLM